MKNLILALAIGMVAASVGCTRVVNAPPAPVPQPQPQPHNRTIIVTPPAVQVVPPPAPPVAPPAKPRVNLDIIIGPGQAPPPPHHHHAPGCRCPHCCR